MPYVVLGDKYARAIKDGAHAQPVLFPLADAQQIPQLLAVVDGVMLTGSPSNVHPCISTRWWRILICRWIRCAMP